MKSFCLINRALPEESFSVLQSAVERILKLRGCAVSDAGTKIELIADAAMNEDQYAVSADAEGAKATFGGVGGCFAAVGDYLRRCAFDGAGECRLFRGAFALKPRNPVHGMYFASHFQNFYEAAPIDQVEHIIEDLALRGCNALMVWYDMHQYAAVDDPKSVKMIERLKKMLRRATLTGMKTVFGTLANEAFSTSDPAIRAEWVVQNGYFKQPCGHYHVEICPNKQGGIPEILRLRRQVLEAFSDVKLDYISLWPYDQGGCTCEKCTPWGANGFLKTVKALRGLLDEMLPECKILLSTWYFDRFVRGEWAAFRDAVSQGGYEFVDSLFGYFANDEPVPDFMRKGETLVGKGMVAFPEISMYGADPWGGYGANPMPGRFESNFKGNGKLYNGALPYSEGIFEDLNKSMMLAYFSGRDENPRSVTEEYARFEFCMDDQMARDFADMMEAMESTLNRKITEDGKPLDNWLSMCEVPPESLGFAIENPARVDEAEALAAKLDAALPPMIRENWRWRIYRLRAAIDHELTHHNMKPTEKTDEYMQELCRIYFGDDAYYVVAPPTRKAIKAWRGGTV